MTLRAPHPNLGLLPAAVDPSRTALVDLGRPGAPAMTYAALGELADAVARGLVARGIKAGDRVAILAQNRGAYVAVLLGALRCLAVPVPINIKLPPDVVRTILADSGTRLAFVEDGTAHLAGDLPHVHLDDWDAFLDAGPFEAAAPPEKMVSMQIYTSGTTGAPKGTLLTHAGQVWAAETLTAARRLTADDRAVMSAPFFHKNALVAIKTALLSGATMLILPRFDVAATIGAIRDHGATMLTGVPTMMAMLLQHKDRLDGVDTKAVRAVSMGSAPASDGLLADIAAAFPNATIHLNYGTTEGGPIMTGWFGPRGELPPRGSVGYPIKGCEFRFDGGTAREGELVVRNPGVALGYHNNPEKTAERFVAGWYRTGDILRLDDEGWMYFVARVDDMFVVGGENVYPQDVVSLLEEHPSVAQAAVLPFPHAMKGVVPYAFVVPSGEAIDEDGLKAFTIARGPAYAHPRRIIAVDTIPLTGTNKIDAKALRALVDD